MFFVKSALKRTVAALWRIRPSMGTYITRLKSKNIKVGQNSRISLKATILIRGGGSIEIGDGCYIHPYVHIVTYGGRIRIGDNVTVNPFSVLYGHGNLDIGSGVRIATHCVFIGANHNFNDAERPIYTQGVTSEGITIEDDVWFGAGARILSGVTVRHGCVIGAGAVVTKSTELYGIYVGVPAKLINVRKKLRNVSTNNEHI